MEQKYIFKVFIEEHRETEEVSIIHCTLQEAFDFSINYITDHNKRSMRQIYFDNKFYRWSLYQHQFKLIKTIPDRHTEEFTRWLTLEEISEETISELILKETTELHSLKENYKRQVEARTKIIRKLTKISKDYK